MPIQNFRLPIHSVIPSVSPIMSSKQDFVKVQDQLQFYNLTISSCILFFCFGYAFCPWTWLGGAQHKMTFAATVEVWTMKAVPLLIWNFSCKELLRRRNLLSQRMGQTFLNNCLITFIEREFFLQAKDEDIIKYFQNMKHRKVIL